MVLKRAKCDLNGVKIVFFSAKSQKLPSSWGLCPLCDTLELQRFVQHGTQIWQFLCEKTFTFGSSPFFLSKTLFALLVAFAPADRFFKRLYRRIGNELVNAAGLICIFFQRWIQNCSFKISVFMCKSSVYFVVPPHFRLKPLHFVWSDDDTAGSVWLSRSHSIYRS